MSRTITATAAAVLVSAALLAGYLALGGGDFEPAAPQPPCGRQAAESVDGGLTGTAERIGLNALNATACDLGIPRERLLLGLAGETELDIDPQRRTDAFRTGLRRAIDDEERAGRLGGTEAFLLRQAANFLPVDALIERLFRGG